SSSSCSSGRSTASAPCSEDVPAPPAVPARHPRPDRRRSQHVVTASGQTPEAVMHAASRCLLIAVLTALAVPALAQTTSPYAVNWSSLNAGNDWTVIGQLVGQFTGFVGAIACLFVCYTTLTNIHRAAETARALGSNQS